ncbi:C40 family peptidase [Cohnella yongneupensis]|uniref:SH3 domain-containing protein n=1 Tax=Cohnella yongneupensis TaxID=425006 RepID=A0ABW0R1P6_9BACL
MLTMLMAVPAFAAAATATAGSTADIVASVSFRSGPSTSSTVLKYLKAGEKVTIVETVNSYWYKVKESQGNIGYISSSETYVDVKEQPVSTGNAVIVASVSFRTEPSTSGGRIRFLQKDEPVTITSQVNGYWYAVTDKNGVSGYVSTSDQYVKVTGQITPPITVPTGNAVIVASVSFRKEPSTSGERMRFLQKDEPITITSKVNSYWYAVTDKDGVSGYVSTSDEYVKVTGTIPTPKPDPTPSVPVSQQVESVIAAGMKYLGTPYEFGSSRNTTTTFDCSDFVRQAFKDALGVVLPADSRQQGAYVRERSSVTTDWHSLKRGDLLFFMDYKGSGASNYADKDPFGETIRHVGIYLGNGQMLHTYSTESGGVRVSDIAGTQWENRFLFGGSAL